MSRLNVDQIRTRTGTGSPAIREMPAFRATLSTNQNVTAGQFIRVNLDTVTGEGAFDTNGWFHTANYRYVPQIAGYYQFDGLVRCQGTNQTAQGARLWKNGSVFALGNLNRVVTSSGVHVSVSSLIYLNGSSDYVELAGFSTGTGPLFGGGTSSEASFLSGFLVRPD